MCMGVSPTHMSIHHAHAVLKEVRRRCQIPWYWSYRWWGVTTRVLRIKSGSSGKTAKACKLSHLSNLSYWHLNDEIFTINLDGGKLEYGSSLHSFSILHLTVCTYSVYIQKIFGWVMAASTWEGYRNRQISMNSRPAWSTERVPGLPSLHREAVLKTPPTSKKPNK